MLYIFKSKAAADLIMLEPNGRRILQIIGKCADEGAPAKGILLPEQMPAAIAALQAAIAQEDQGQQQAKAQAAERGQNWQRSGEAVSLRQRAKPFIDMLQRCQAANKEIVWGV
jgi:hypothetical protein